MAGFILRNEDKSVVIPVSHVDKLISTGDGDAVLLYLTLQRYNRAMTPEELMEKLKWNLLRLNNAESVLEKMQIITSHMPKVEPDVKDEHRTYAQEEITQMISDNEEFRMLVAQVDQKLGKKMKMTDLQILAALYDDIGMPADVIYLLVCHCVERCEARYGEGRKPTLRQIEREGAYWSRLGVMTQEEASKYLLSYAQKQEKSIQYMHVLGLGNRHPIESEAKYIEDWIAKGFPPETVAIAYERTLFQIGSMKWQYLNGILKNWHSKGMHTPDEIETGEKKTPSKTVNPTTNASGSKSWMGQYIKKG